MGWRKDDAVWRQPKLDGHAGLRSERKNVHDVRRRRFGSRRRRRDANQYSVHAVQVAGRGAIDAEAPLLIDSIGAARREQDPNRGWDLWKEVTDNNLLGFSIRCCSYAFRLRADEAEPDRAKNCQGCCNYEARRNLAADLLDARPFCNLPQSVSSADQNLQPVNVVGVRSEHARVLVLSRHELGELVAERGQELRRRSASGSRGAWNEVLTIRYRGDDFPCEIRVASEERPIHPAPEVLRVCRRLRRTTEPRKAHAADRGDRHDSTDERYYAHPEGNTRYQGN